MSSAAYIVGAIILCILFWLIAAAAIVKAGKWSNRMALELELHAPLLYVQPLLVMLTRCIFIALDTLVCALICAAVAFLWRLSLTGRPNTAWTPR